MQQHISVEVAKFLSNFIGSFTNVTTEQCPYIQVIVKISHLIFTGHSAYTVY